MRSSEPVVIVAYDASWPAKYSEEAARVSRALGERLLAIEHVGSTAVVGLAAKPVIDIVAAIDRLDSWEALTPALLAEGYAHQSAGDMDSRRFFRRFENGIRRSHLSLTEARSPFWVKHLAFRDALRSDPLLAERYAALKVRLARELGHDRRAYTDGKDEFVASVLQRSVGC
jgi:GrpB-like predicted nucleotidyltransferase (UPF0157 family)